MSKTIVIHVNDMQDGDVYIGRAVPRRGLALSKWSNPFKVGKDGTREEVIERFRHHFERKRHARPTHYDLSELRGKRLACWCHPEPCHGDVLAELADSK